MQGMPCPDILPRRPVSVVCECVGQWCSAVPVGLALGAAAGRAGRARWRRLALAPASRTHLTQAQARRKRAERAASCHTSCVEREAEGSRSHGQGTQRGPCRARAPARHARRADDDRAPRGRLPHAQAHRPRRNGAPCSTVPPAWVALSRIRIALPLCGVLARLKQSRSRARQTCTSRSSHARSDQ